MGLREDAISRIREFIAAETHPDKMSAKDAVQVLEEIEADISGMIDALNDQIRDEQDRPDDNPPSNENVP